MLVKWTRTSILIFDNVFVCDSDKTSIREARWRDTLSRMHNTGICRAAFPRNVSFNELYSETNDDDDDNDADDTDNKDTDRN